MAQPTITNFFSNRKRPALDELKSKTKVMALDSAIADSGYCITKSTKSSVQDSSRIKKEAIVFSNDEVSKSKPLGISTPSRSKARTVSTPARRATKPKDSKQADMKSFLLAKPEASKPSTTSETLSANVNLPANESDQEGSKCATTDCVEVKEECQSKTLEKNAEEPVQELSSEHNAVNPVEVKPEAEVSEVIVPVLSEGAKDKVDDCNTGSISIVVTSADESQSISKKGESSKSVHHDERKESNLERARRELSLGDIKSKLTRSARLAELKASMARLDEGREKLNQISKAKQSLQVVNAHGPQLNQFNSIEVEVPSSPSKSPMKSPMKSPLKSAVGSRSPAFQRYSSLAQAGTPSLTLPYSYRHLAELFRCVDTVVSLLFNRKETITFGKLQPAVQEMSRKTFMQSHLAQILTVFPKAFVLKQEKFHKFGMPSHQDKYQLVIEPSLESDPTCENEKTPSMTPSLLLERRRRFFSNLLSIVKKHHQDFLQSLDPPLNVPLESLTCWHPEFAVDQVPEVVAAPLPEPPNLEKCYSAKDVLAKARQLYSCNSRMEKALQSVAAHGNISAQPSKVNIEVVNPSNSITPPSPSKNSQLSAALKGIPKAILEKVRARQAAKALDAMTRTPAQCKEAVQYARLPELSRILRNVFVVEKKGALPLEFVLEKVGNSYRSALSSRELDEHIRLLAKAVPGWLTFEHLLKTDYLRLCKKADMNRVLKKLTDLADSKHNL